jgi:hypothetical protein
VGDESRDTRAQRSALRTELDGSRNRYSKRSKYEKRTDCQASLPEADTDKNRISQHQLQYAANQDY